MNSLPDMKTNADQRANGRSGVRSSTAGLKLCLFMSLLVLGWSMPGYADDACGAVDNSAEPTVTKDESKVLNAALEVAVTNATQAIQMLKAIPNIDTASAAIDFAIGNLYFQQNQLAPAEKAYAVAIKKMPKFRSARKNLGRIYLLNDKLDSAIEMYQQLIADGQADADIFLLTGHALLLQNYPVSAESAYRQSLLLRQKNHDAMLGLAKTLMVQERYAEGLALIGEILEETPANRELWELRANAYLSMDKHEDAVRAIETAWRMGCTSPELLATLGDLYLNQDQPVDALRAYAEAFQDKSLSVSRRLRAIEGFLMINDVAKAQQMIDQTEALRTSLTQNEKVTLLRLKGDIAMRLNQMDQAITYCKEVLQIDPLAGQTLLLMATIQHQQGLAQEAIINCERAARIQGFEVEALILNAQIAIAEERYASAVTLLEAAQTFKDQPHVARYLEQLRRML